MIVYTASKTQFLDDVLTNDIENIVTKRQLANIALNDRGAGFAVSQVCRVTMPFQSNQLH